MYANKAGKQHDRAFLAMDARGCRFSAWCETKGLTLAAIRPLHVAAYIEGLSGELAKPTVKQHLAALRMLFDWLVIGHVLDVNPAHAVRGPKHVVKKGRTPVLDRDEARALLDGRVRLAPTQSQGIHQSGLKVLTQGGNTPADFDILIAPRLLGEPQRFVDSASLDRAMSPALAIGNPKQ